MSFFKRHPQLNDEDTSDGENVDPNLRLRTTLTAHSTIAESIRSELRQQRRKKSLARGRFGFGSRKHGTVRSTHSTATTEAPSATEDLHRTETQASEPAQAQSTGQRRMVYVNLPLPESETKSNGDPVVRYERNKVRTSKYTIITFIPKNLYEQFRRVANLYFLALVVLQVFPVFGAAAPQIAMVPLVVILSITAAKDGIEDYRRASLDDEVNNSAATKLSPSSSWRNPNQPRDPRNWFERLLGLGTAPGKVTRGVKRLRAKERERGAISVTRQTMESDVSTTQDHDRTRSLEDIQSITTAESGNIVPISLYISIEIVKTIQAYFIAQDRDMYYAPLDTACVPKTWNISDDLGQIAYIFSDKTGTLTQNVMEFMRCSIAGVRYGEGITEAMRGAAKRRSADGGEHTEEDREAESQRLDALKVEMVALMERAFKNRWFRRDKLTMISPQLARDLTASPQTPKSNLPSGGKDQRHHIIEFFRALAICHTVLPDIPDDDDDEGSSNSGARTPGEPRLDYKAESPDEAALVSGARDAGFPFLARSNNALDIEVMGMPERYTPLRVLEFNSTRKRMSVIVRDPNGRLVLYCKGADSVIYERLAGGQDVVREKTREDMEAFANGGLRTLCIAYRYLSEEEYISWGAKYDEAASAVKDRDDKIDRANELIEHSLLILGATALEDKLQEGVPDAIEQLHRAGIKLWILTGDKLQTAIEIGYSCNLLKADMEVMIISATSADGARSQIEAGLNKIASVLGPPAVNGAARVEVPGSLKRGFAVVIDGDTLRFALDESLKPLFLNLGTQCDTVVCCRVSPAQKAQTVKLVKDGKNAMTLSIGDGANDVAMIQEANIGCGLMGLEGSQAAMSADYAFGQFRFLTKLLLVHGRWSYQRVADMHSNFFYKNVIWTFAMFWFCFWNSFDATYLYQYTFILLYNTAHNSLPSAAFDQDINAKASLAFPQLYKRGILGLEYTQPKFWAYMFDGLYQSVVVYFIPYFIWTNPPAVSWSGKGIDSLADFGTTVSVAAIFSANIYVGINTRYWTVLTWIVTLGSMAVLLIWIAVYSQFESVDFNDEISILFSTMSFWGAVVLSISVAITPRFLVKFFTQAYMPLDKDIIREAWVAGDLKDQLGIKHRKKSKNSYQESSALYKGSGSEDGYQPASLSRPGEFDYVAPTPGQGLSPLEPGGTPQLIVTTPVDEYDVEQQRTPRVQQGYFEHHQQRSPVMTSVSQSPLTTGGEYEMGQLHRPGMHQAEESVQSRASDRSFVTAQSQAHSRPTSWDPDDQSPRAI
ncbi:hypothetical protein FRC07_014357 [Ceratobasidium sp. 392]|nr:hypothetical protein FRC07_014357 [Ceratobasidium sp. 392]